jgi:uncharacterized membrane protein YphA (DoxX/SURF4 family)
MLNYSKWSAYVVLVVMLVTSAGFAVSGFSKLAGAEVPTIEFAIWGYPAWSLYAVGAMEVIGAAAIWSARALRFGLLLLGLVVIAATITHIRFEEWTALNRPAAFAVMLSYIAVHRLAGGDRGRLPGQD